MSAIYRPDKQINLHRQAYRFFIIPKNVYSSFQLIFIMILCNDSVSLIFSTTDQGNDRIGAKAALCQIKPPQRALITDTSHINPIIPPIRCTIDLSEKSKL